jgi:hypothetical protein
MPCGIVPQDSWEDVQYHSLTYLLPWAPQVIFSAMKLPETTNRPQVMNEMRKFTVYLDQRTQEIHIHFQASVVVWISSTESAGCILRFLNVLVWIPDNLVCSDMNSKPWSNTEISSFKSLGSSGIYFIRTFFVHSEKKLKVLKITFPF